MDYPYSLQAYPGQRIMSPIIQTTTSATSPTLEYDAESTQTKGHGMLYEVPPLKRVSSLEREIRGTTGRLKSSKHNLIARQTSTVGLQEGIPKAKSGRNGLKIICRIFFILLVLGILWVPGILSWEFPKARLLGVNFLWWSIWFTFVWAGFWTVVAVSYFTPTIFKSAPLVVSVHRWQHIHEVRAAHKYRGIFFWMIGVWLSYQLLVVRTLPVNTPAQTMAIINLIGRLLLGIVICAAFFTLEKSSIQRITENFHERSFAKRIQDLETIVRALGILYKNTVDIVIRSDARDSELIFDSNCHPGNLKFYSEGLKGATGRGEKRPAAEIPWLQGQTLEPLGSSTTSESLLARRIFYSFSRPGANCLTAEDIAAFFPTPADAAIAFALFDRDRNGDVSKEELEAVCLEFYQERASIADSIRDMNAALSQLNGIMMSFSYVACAVILAVVMDTQIAPLIAGVGALVLGLSWLIGGSLQEVMTSIIFVFVKHPFDVGDSVTIKDETYRVKEINLLSTVFLDTNSTLLQVSNHQLNNLFIYNSRRSSHISETFNFDVHYSTTFQEVERIRDKMLEFVKSESRDFQPVFDVVVKDFPGQSRMILSADVKYKSNLVGLKVMRRNKWLCALKSTLAELHIYGPTGDRNAPLTVQRHTKVPLKEVERNDLDHCRT